MTKLHKPYAEFMEKLNSHNISWCLIKDFDYLMKTGYDNEIDMVVLGKDRHKIMNLGVSLGWYPSSLNKLNTHVIFWRFEKGVPYRIDVHVDKVLATAVPWFRAEDILNDKVKQHGIWKASEKWELGILLLSSFRGRTPKKHRVERAKALKHYLPEAKIILKSKLNEREVDKYYSALTKGVIVKLSKLKRLGIANIMKEKILLLKMFLLRLANPSPDFVISGENTPHKKKVLSKLLERLKYAKLNVVLLGDVSFPRLFWSKVTSDLVLVNSTNANGIEMKQKNVESEVKSIIEKLYP